MEQQPLTPGEEQSAWEFSVQLEFIRTVEDMFPPDNDNSWITRRPIAPMIVGGAACELTFSTA